MLISCFLIHLETLPKHRFKAAQFFTFRKYTFSWRELEKKRTYSHLQTGNKWKQLAWLCEGKNSVSYKTCLREDCVR